MTNKIVQFQDKIHCNRCDRVFEAPKQLIRESFMGQRATRISEPCTCPHCNQSDWHWVYASDVIPAEITQIRNPDKRKILEIQWLKNN